MRVFPKKARWCGAVRRGRREALRRWIRAGFSGHGRVKA